MCALGSWAHEVVQHVGTAGMFDIIVQIDLAGHREREGSISRITKNANPV